MHLGGVLGEEAQWVGGDVLGGEASMIGSDDGCSWLEGGGMGGRGRGVLINREWVEPAHGGWSGLGNRVRAEEE